MRVAWSEGVCIALGEVALGEGGLRVGVAWDVGVGVTEGGLEVNNE